MCITYAEVKGQLGVHLSFYQTHVIRLEDRHLYPISHPATHTQLHL